MKTAGSRKVSAGMRIRRAPDVVVSRNDDASRRMTRGPEVRQHRFEINLGLLKLRLPAAVGQIASHHYEVRPRSKLHDSVLQRFARVIVDAGLPESVRFGATA